MTGADAVRSPRGKSPPKTPVDAVTAHEAFMRHTRLLRRSRWVRLAGYALVAAGITWLAAAEATAHLGATALMAAGALVAIAAAAWVGRAEMRDPQARAALRRLVPGYALKLAALPLLALGGGWLAFGTMPLDAGLAAAGLGFCAYAYGIVARIDGVSSLPDRNPGGV